MYENIDDNGRIVVCRRKHTCEWCGETILPRERAVRRVYKFDGIFNSAYQHLGCFSALNQSLPDMWDGSFDAYEQKQDYTITGKKVELPCCDSPGKDKCEQCQEIGLADPKNQW